MELVRKTESLKITFDQLQIGEIFIFDDSIEGYEGIADDVFMVLDEGLFTPLTGNKCGFLYDVYDLVNGGFTPVHRVEKVQLVIYDRE